jgi:hypothetical protein
MDNFSKYVISPGQMCITDTHESNCHFHFSHIKIHIIKVKCAMGSDYFEKAII